jgi:hypothetical protein
MDSAMATIPTPALSDRISAWIDSEGGDHALLFITADGLVRPHVVMLARDEVAVMSATHLRVALGEKSQTAENLRLRSSATLAIYDCDLACVIKTREMKGPRPLQRGTIAYDLFVEEVRFDTPAAAEATARLVTGLRFEGRAERRDLRDRLRGLEP